MQRQVESTDIDKPLEKVLQRLQSCHCSLLTVTESDQLVGIVNLDNIMGLIRIQSVLQEHNGRGKTTLGA